MQNYRSTFAQLPHRINLVSLLVIAVNIRVLVQRPQDTDFILALVAYYCISYYCCVDTYHSGESTVQSVEETPVTIAEVSGFVYEEGDEGGHWARNDGVHDG